MNMTSLMTPANERIECALGRLDQCIRDLRQYVIRSPRSGIPPELKLLLKELEMVYDILENGY